MVEMKYNCASLHESMHKVGGSCMGASVGRPCLLAILWMHVVAGKQIAIFACYVKSKELVLDCFSLGAWCTALG